MKNVQNVKCEEQYGLDKLEIISYTKYKSIKNIISKTKENQYLAIVLGVSAIVLSIDFWFVREFINLLVNIN